jgi:hypothetical protein
VGRVQYNSPDAELRSKSVGMNGENGAKESLVTRGTASAGLFDATDLGLQVRHVAVAHTMPILLIDHEAPRSCAHQRVLWGNKAAQGYFNRWV